jgi:predicted ATP-dependent endonuclease of OLD family
MLTAVLSNEGDLYCIEEPEIHMHPRLQREFVDFVTNRTKNLYLISSHSHVFVDAVNWLDQVQVFHIEATEGTSTGTPILTDDDAVQALNDIGVAPSDLLQSNCVIWVEGPSDRIYIQKWIELLAPDLVEGRDYTILYYAGKLLSHLEFERDKMPDEFISVLRINQRAVVVIDSDRQKPGGRLNQTKERVQRQVEGTGGICWITDGREIENLIPIGPVNRVMEAITGKPVTLELGKYDSFDEAFQKVLDKSAAKAPPYAANKVDYSRKFSEETTSGDLDPTLEVVLNDVISSIRQWNQLA